VTIKGKRIYDKNTHTWYEVPEEQYKEFDQWRTSLRKREQYWNRCFCPRSKWWLCDGNCLDCEFHTRNEVSLDDPLPDGEGTLGDYVPDGAPLIEEVLSEKAELDQLFERLQELMPEAKRIGELREEGLSDEAIADIVGIKRTTFLSRLKKAEGKLSQEFPDWF
jgi:DNA-directed RNA polymerase specialized sigma24 family protein